MLYFKRIFSAFLLVVLLVLLFPAPVQAAYENTYTNTGNYIDDLIGVAKTQVGYREGKSNYTKYGVWYGFPNASWCAIFISWCARQAGIPKSVLPTNSYATPKGFGISKTYRASERTPQPGDLFFRKEGSSWKHAGIVYKVDGTYAHTIEGNTYTSDPSAEGVYYRKRKLNNENYYYGTPNYGVESGHTHSYGELQYETAHPHKQYKACSCGYKYYTGKNDTVDGCQSCCDHSYGAWSSTGASKHQRTCSKCQYIQTKSHSWGKDKILKPATCKTAGSKEQTCTACGETRKTEIAKLKTHTFTAWALLDESNHRRVCSVCAKEETSPHTPTQAWQSDEAQHWQVCSVCEEQIGTAEHSFPESCEAPCEICAYVRSAGHTYSETLTWDETGHFYGCTACGAQKDFAPHTLSQTIAADENGHYYPCVDCGFRGQEKIHVPGPVANEARSQNCTVCHWELAPRKTHTHFYFPMEFDWQNHWGVCACGQNYAPEAHIWDVQTGECTVCFQEIMDPPQKSLLVQVQEFVHWEQISAYVNWEQNGQWILLGGAILLLLLILLTVFLIVRAKKKRRQAVSV